MIRLTSWFAVGLLALSAIGCAEHEARKSEGLAATDSTPSITLTDRVVEVGCGQCMFGLDRPGCETAIRVDGLVFLATGTNIPDAEDHGTRMCETIQRAKVSGTTAGPQFVATSFELLP